MKKTLAVLFIIFHTSYALSADLSAQYESASVGVSKEKLKEFHFIFVPGIFSNFIEIYACYFCEAIGVLKNHGLKEGLDYQKVETHSLGPIQKNLPLIQKAIENSTKPVLLISHSRGSTEVMQLLVENPSLRSQVYGWISVQGVIAGSFFADSLTCDPKTKDCQGTPLRAEPESSVPQIWIQSFYDWLMKTGPDNKNHLNELRQDVRKSFLKNNSTQISDISKDLKILSVSSYKDFDQLPLNYRLGQTYLGRPLQPNDGLVYSNDQVFPSSSYIHLEGHHNELVIQKNKNQQKDFFKKTLNIFWNL